MQLQKIYELAIASGRAADPRPQAEIERHLKSEKKEFEKLEKKERELFDSERLENPYSDTRILVGDPKTDIKKIAVGIDLESDALLLIHELNKSGAKIDLALSHHPEGIALAKLDGVMRLQEDLYAEAGVPVNVIEKIMDKETARVVRSIHPVNHQKNIDFAKILQIPYMCTHTVADNLAYRFVEKLIAKKNPRTLGDIIELLLGEPEFRESAKRGVPPITFVGNKNSKAGKIAVSGFTGGTSSSAKVYESLKHAGVGTEIAMHMKPEAQKEAEKHGINVVVAGHIASDSLGMNLLIDEIEKKSKVEVVQLGGFMRFSRK
ncbi:MAG: Nif3-like dinuclear metal center hexameric protein [Candidatus Peribacteraceae bacterium]|nr:Nif3-like dinuclear metal center hexameric protein [Candidatus Peribacteraceae bacterium]